MNPQEKQQRPFVTLDGNEAAAYVADKLSEVIAIYPITPSSTMGELADQWSSEQQPNIWGSVPHVIEMQSGLSTVRVVARGEKFRLVQLQGNLFVCTRQNGSCCRGWTEKGRLPFEPQAMWGDEWWERRCVRNRLHLTSLDAWGRARSATTRCSSCSVGRSG